MQGQVCGRIVWNMSCCYDFSEALPCFHARNSCVNSRGLMYIKLIHICIVFVNPYLRSVFKYFVHVEYRPLLLCRYYTSFLSNNILRVYHYIRRHT